jgi:2-keto-4-pentenoate hydratase
MQEMFGVHEPDYGHLVDDMFVADGQTVPHATYMQPRVEPEIAFVLDAPIKGPGVTVADVLRATAFVLPAIEIIDTRFSTWKIQLADTIADNASSAGVVLGSRPTAPGAVDLKTVGGVLRRNGEILETGAGGAVLGHPAIAVAWLANTLAGFAIELEPGHVIVPGSFTRAIDVFPGDQINVDIERLGSVSVGFG